MISVIVKEHTKDCYAKRYFLAKKWNTVWSFLSDKHTYGTIYWPKRKGSTHRWVYAGCNCVDCPAEVAILEESILIDVIQTTHKFSKTPKDTRR